MKEQLFESVLCYDNMILAWKTVKDKGSTGGIDDISIKEYSANIDHRIRDLITSIREGMWVPRPYMFIEIPKTSGGNREIGLMTIEDKIVQTAVKQVIEPVIEKFFYPASYAYRPGKGHLKCVRAALHYSRRHPQGYYVRCDIDNFFDSVNREILFKRLKSVISDEKLLRLIQICVSMGGLDKSMVWKSSDVGLPQGAILSPLLANFYLTPFDQSMMNKVNDYLRYSDDFVFWSDSFEEATGIAERSVDYLGTKLGLSLNACPVAVPTNVPMDFLGLLITPSEIELSNSRMMELETQVGSIEMKSGEPTKTYWKGIDGIRRYYLQALPSRYAVIFREVYNRVVERWKQEGVVVNETVKRELQERLFGRGDLDEPKKISAIASKQMKQRTVKEVIDKRKREYLKLEAENSELIISGPGYFIGAGERGLMLRKNGQPVRIRSAAVKHITIASGGVGFSSNLVYYCKENGITIDFFRESNKHVASILSPGFLKTDLWRKQALFSDEHKLEIAKTILIGKVKNQINLCKYFNKYHKYRGAAYAFDVFLDGIETVLAKIREYCGGDDYRKTLMAYEARGAELYWDYVRELVLDDDVEFYSRVQQGAKDVMNSMLNYGYGLLYPRIWQAILRRGMNPYDGFIHHAEGLPHLVFDFIELFRSQAVDRVVIGIVQKKIPCSVDSDGRLTEETRTILTERVMERLYRREMYRGESRMLIDIIDLQAKELSESLKSNCRFRPYLAKW